MLIEFSKINIKLFFPLIFPIFYRIERYISTTYFEKDNNLFKTFRYFLSYLLCIIPYLIIRIRSSRKNYINRDSENEIKKSKNMIEIFVEGNEENVLNRLIKKQDKKKKTINILYLLLLSCLGFICQFYKFWFDEKNYRYARQSLGILFDMIFYILLSHFILKQELYKHNIVSAVIMAIILIILLIKTFFYINIEDILLCYLFYFLNGIFFSSYNIVGKQYLIKCFKTPYFLLLMIGSFVMPCLLINDLMIYIFDSSIKGIVAGFKDNIVNLKLFFLFIADIITQCFWNLGIWLVNYYLTPSHIFISEYISEYAYFIMNVIFDQEEFYTSYDNIIIFTISFLINFFLCLIFNEVIILNFSKLDYNTRKRINERAKKDHKKLLNKDVSITTTDGDISKTTEESAAEDLTTN